MSEATKTEEEFTRIDISQHGDILKSLEKTDRQGRFWYFAEANDPKPYIGIRKAGGAAATEQFADKGELFYWLRHGTDGDPFAPDNKPSTVKSEQQPAAAATLFPEDPFDSNDPMAVMQAAQGTPSIAEATGQTAVAVAEELTSLVVDYTELSDQDLTATIKAAEEAYFTPYREYAVAEARLNEKQAKFNEENENLIVAKKTAAKLKEITGTSLRKIALEYARRNPEDKQFDAYVSFKVFEDIDIDEPKAMAWAEEHYPAALNKSQVSLDNGRVVTYVKDLKKRKEAIPEFATVKQRTEAQISSKIRVPELEVTEVQA